MPRPPGRRPGATAALLSAWLCAALTACAGNGEGLDPNGRPVGEGDPGTEPLTADFDSIQAHVFTPVCTACHAGGAAPQGLRLDAASSYDLLVGVPSTQQPSVLRVAPGDPDRSYLVQKLEGDAAVGARMPFGGPYLEQATIDVIRQWIVDGAQRSPAGAAAAKSFVLAASVPADGDVLAAPPSSLVVAFTRELDRTRLGPSTVRLDRLDVGAAAATGVAIATDVLVSDANPAALQVRPRADLPPGRYALHVDRAGIADLSGQSLAPSARISANESPLVITFRVEARP